VTEILGREAGELKLSLRVVYHFYCAVGGKTQHRASAVATSKDLGKSDFENARPFNPNGEK